MEDADRPYDPITDFPRQLLPPGFDFSDPQIRRIITHYRRPKACEYYKLKAHTWDESAA